jgi:hypothetical protein
VSPDTDELLGRTAQGDRAARDQMLARHWRACAGRSPTGSTADGAGI